MNRAYLPFSFLPSRSLVEAFGPDLNLIALRALRAVLQHRKSLEVAHQQFTFRDHHIALSSRITAEGQLIVELDAGDPHLVDRLILEDDFRRAMRSNVEKNRPRQRRRGIAP